MKEGMRMSSVIDMIILEHVKSQYPDLRLIDTKDKNIVELVKIVSGIIDGSNETNSDDILDDDGFSVASLDKYLNPKSRDTDDIQMRPGKPVAFP